MLTIRVPQCGHGEISAENDAGIVYSLADSLKECGAVIAGQVIVVLRSGVEARVIPKSPCDKCVTAPATMQFSPVSGPRRSLGETPHIAAGLNRRPVPRHTLK